MRAILFITLLWLLTAVEHSATYYVPDNYGTIQEVIDGSQAGTVVTCNTGEGPDTISEGFTLYNGSLCPARWPP